MKTKDEFEAELNRRWKERRIAMMAWNDEVRLVIGIMFEMTAEVLSALPRIAQSADELQVHDEPKSAKSVPEGQDKKLCDDAVNLASGRTTP